MGDTGKESKSLGTETLPLTCNDPVKFRQTYDKIPVYGSLVPVEFDNNNVLVSLNSALARLKMSIRWLQFRQLELGDR